MYAFHHTLVLNPYLSFDLSLSSACSLEDLPDLVCPLAYEVLGDGGLLVGGDGGRREGEVPRRDRDDDEYFEDAWCEEGLLLPADEYPAVSEYYY